MVHSLANFEFLLEDRRGWRKVVRRNNRGRDGGFLELKMIRIVFATVLKKIGTIFLLNSTKTK